MRLHFGLVRQWTMVFLVAVASYCSVILVQTSTKHRDLGRDLAAIQHIKYGLLDAGQWAARLGPIIGSKATALVSTDAGRAELRPVLATVVAVAFETLQVRVEDKIDLLQLPQELKDIPLVGTKLEQAEASINEQIRRAIKNLISEARRLAPILTDILLHEIETRQGALTQAIDGKVNEFVATTVANGQRDDLFRLAAKYECEEVRLAVCEDKIANQMNQFSPNLRSYPIIILGSVFLGLLLCLCALSTVKTTEVMLLVAGACVLLLGGLMNPMMSIEAKLLSLSFTFLGEPVVFENQVIFFQSKSIFDVVAVLAQSGAIDMIVVAIMIAGFSVFFPVAKLVCSCFYYFNFSQLRSNRVVHFFALKSGKWSMADVFVIAIFMAYIGFGGLIDSQLSQLPSGSEQGLSVNASPNATAFQPGLFLFAGFCIVSLFVSSIVERIFGAPSVKHEIL